MDRLQERERDERISELVRSFLEARSFTFKYVEPYGRDGKVEFPRLHEFVETDLFNLKEECHLVFRPQGQDAPSAATTGVLFDLLIGSVFHEMMKIKENIYHLEFYSPVVEQLSERAEREKIPDYERDFIREYRRIERRARKALKADIQSVVEILRDAADNLKTLLRENHQSSLLARILVECEELVNETYGDNGLDKTLAYMFDGDLAEGYLAAGRDFLEGGWYEKASSLFDKALALNPEKQLAVQLKKRVEQAVSAVRSSPASRAPV